MTLFLFREKALKTLIALATGVTPDHACLSLTDEAMTVFNHVTESLLTNEEQFAYCDMQYNYLPQFFVEWNICHAWFLYFTQNVQASVSMLKDVIGKIQNIIRTRSYQENQ